MMERRNALPKIMCIALSTFGFMIHGIIPVSGGPFGSNLGASFWSQDSIDEIKQDAYGMESLDRTLHEFENFLNKYI